MSGSMTSEEREELERFFTDCGITETTKTECGHNGKQCKDCEDLGGISFQISTVPDLSNFGSQHMNHCPPPKTSPKKAANKMVRLRRKSEFFAAPSGAKFTENEITVLSIYLKDSIQEVYTDFVKRCCRDRNKPEYSLDLIHSEIYTKLRQKILSHPSFEIRETLGRVFGGKFKSLERRLTPQQGSQLMTLFDNLSKYCSDESTLNELQKSEAETMNLMRLHLAEADRALHVAQQAADSAGRINKNIQDLEKFLEEGSVQ